MDNSSITAVIVALISSGIITVMLNAFFGRKESKARSENIAITGMEKLVDELQQERGVIQKERESMHVRLSELQNRTQETLKAQVLKMEEFSEELRIQAESLEVLVFNNLKYQLALKIIIRQLEMLGVEPLIKSSEIEDMTVDDLKEVEYRLTIMESKNEK